MHNFKSSQLLHISHIQHMQALTPPIDRKPPNEAYDPS